MMDTTVVMTDLDRLAERVERAASLVQELREKLATAEAEKAGLVQRLEETSGKLQGADPTAVMSDLAALKKEQREWTAERKDVAGRIEALLKKLERIEV